MFGFEKAKTWVLLADMADKSLMRNYFAYKTAKCFDGCLGVTECPCVELYFNNRYDGVYLFASK